MIGPSTISSKKAVNLKLILDKTKNGQMYFQNVEIKTDI